MFIPRYGLQRVPWCAWASGSNKNPDWWRSYNRVKHERNAHFQEATLENAIDAMGALLVVMFLYYMKTLPLEPLAPGGVYLEKEIMLKLVPDSALLRLNPAYYYNTLIG